MKNKRICYGCGLNKTQLEQGRYPSWRLNSPTDLVLCKNCYFRYIINPQKNPINAPIYNPSRIQFKGKTTFLKGIKINPRSGICSNCGIKVGETFTTTRGKQKIMKRTHLHHIEYHEDDPLKDTVELCMTCHNFMHKKPILVKI